MNISQNRINEILDNVKNKSIIVVGDIMIDEYLWGTVERISPEAPVPVIDLQSQTFRLGGAANVAWNIHKFGINTHLVGVIGDDTSGKVFINELNKIGIKDDGLIIDSNRSTTRKTRVIAHNQQVVRIDREVKNSISEETENRIISKVNELMENADGLIISDYFKGVITPNVIYKILKNAIGEKKFIAVDPKEKYYEYFKGVSILTPNVKEAGKIVGEKLVTDDDVIKAGQNIISMLNAESLLITRGEKGMSLFEKNGDITNFPAVAKEVFDVTGAGDTVIAILTSCAVSGANLKESAYISNQAAGIVVGELGTSAVTIDDIKKRCKE